MIRGLVKLIAYTLTAVLLLLYGGALLATVVPPDKAIVFSFLGMAMPVVWLLLVIMLLFWLFNCKWGAALMLAAVIGASVPLWRNTIAIPTGKVLSLTDRPLKIMTYNVHLFNGYKHYDEICALIERESPDILCLQEFGYFNRRAEGDVKERELLKRFRKMFPYRHLWYKNSKGTSSNGLATFSKYPIVKKENVAYDSKYNNSIYSDVKVGRDTLRVINNHLESNRLTGEQRRWAENLITEEFETEEFIASTKSVSMTLGEATVRRAAQAAAVGQEVERSPHGVVVCGDFNDVCQSYAYSRIKGTSLKDAYAEAGRWGYWWTYHENMMYFPIDHILVEKSLPVKEAYVIKEDFSDHYPLVTVIYMPKE